MNKDSILSAAILGIAIALGLSVAGISISRALYHFKASQRVVTVKGLAENTVRANLAIWPLSFQTVGNDLQTVQKKMEIHRNKTTAFLQKLGFDKNELSYSAPTLRDTSTEPVYGERQETKYRYIGKTTVIIRSSKIDQIKASGQQMGELIAQGIVLLPESWVNKTTYIFTDLNEIKPEMIKQATMNARDAADQFAKDSGSTVGKIKNANQGYFSIEDRDSNSPDWKKIRVVTTVQYFLGN